MVFDGTPPFSADFPRACRAFMASGTIIAGLLIRACIVSLLQLCCCHIGSISFVTAYDERRRTNVTMSETAGRQNTELRHRTPALDSGTDSGTGLQGCFTHGLSTGRCGTV